MNKKAVATFLIAMVLVAGAILLGIRAVQSGFFTNLFSKEETNETTVVLDTNITEATTTAPEVVNFQSEADAYNYVANYCSQNNIDLSLYPQRIFGLFVRNPNALEFVLNYPLHVNAETPTTEETEVTGDVDISEETTAETVEETIEEAETTIPSIVTLEGEISTARVTTLYTWDERWGYTTYGNGDFCFTGSAPTCVSIAAMYLLRNPAFSPQWVAEYSMNNGYCDENCDGSHESSLVGDGGFGLGINVTQIPASDEDRIKRNLDVPNLIICDVGDHYIILISYEEENFTVIDPTSEYDTNRTWSWSELSGRLEGLWVYRVL